MSKKYCVWSGEESDDLNTVSYEVKGVLGMQMERIKLTVCSAHRNDVDAYIAHYNRYAPLFVGSMTLITLAVVIILIYGSVTGTATRTAIGWAATTAGAVLAAFPFATATTTGILGIRTSCRMTRIAGVALAVGAFVAFVL